jgi:hypothetical protein
MIRGNGLGVTNLFSSGSVLGRNATVSKLLEEALACGQLELEEGGTGKLRMVEIISYKILAICRPEAVLESVSSTGVSFTTFGT